MIVMCVHIWVKPENLDEFLKVTLENHNGTRKEPGNIRFDVLQSADDPTRFMLYEVFASQEAIEHHRTTPHYIRFRDSVNPWMAKTREGLKYKVLAPLEKF